MERTPYLIYEQTVNQVPVFLISLADQIDRRRRLSERNLPKEWVENYLSGFDLRSERVQPLETLADLEKLKVRMRRPILASEIGCAISHRMAAARLLETGSHLALVLEDDVVPAGGDWIERLKAIAHVLLPHAKSGAAFICHLGARHDQADAAICRKVVYRNGHPPKAIPELYLHADPDRSLWRAHAYLISRAAAAKDWHNEIPVMTLADDWSERRRLGFFDEIFFTRPILIGQDEDVPSTIGTAGQRDEITTIEKANTLANESAGLLSDVRLAQRIQASFRFRFMMTSARIRARFPYNVNLEFCELEGVECGSN